MGRNAFGSILNPENKKVSPSCSALQTSSGMATSANDKAETLNNYFESILTVEDTQNLPDIIFTSTNAGH